MTVPTLSKANFPTLYEASDTPSLGTVTGENIVVGDRVNITYGGNPPTATWSGTVTSQVSGSTTEWNASVECNQSRMVATEQTSEVDVDVEDASGSTSTPVESPTTIVPPPPPPPPSS